VSGPQFRPLDDVVYGVAEQVGPSIRRVIAENPSKYTYRGTGTYIVGHGDVVVIDPGPLLDSHRDALAAALAGERVRAILVTHCHSDHSPLAAWLAAETDAPTFAVGPHPLPDPQWEELAIDWPDEPDPAEDPAEVIVEESTDFDFEPSHRVADGELVVDTPTLRCTAVFTPGHTSNHTCWAVECGPAERALFTGDHVMGWSTTVVSPPDGDMAQYIESLRAVDRHVAGAPGTVLWPTHGPSRDDAAEYVAALVHHRLDRERAVLDAVRADHASIAEIVELLYVATPRTLHRAARRSVWGHLIKLVDEGHVQVEGLTKPGIRSRYSA
jgi:glyoxylase-like metal-dependent hydrolase (beta-lactamase superfamily II)